MTKEAQSAYLELLAESYALLASYIQAVYGLRVRAKVIPYNVHFERSDKPAF